MIRLAAPSPPASPLGVAGVMRFVLFALLPAALVQACAFGPGVLTNIALTVVFAWLAEALALTLRRRPVLSALGDGSVTVTAVLLALAVPPQAPPLVLLFAAAFAVLVAKHAYGGLGTNPFNPAMAGYAAVLVSFPAVLAIWPEAVWLGAVDGTTGATALAHQRHAPLAAELGVAVAPLGLDPWPYINLAYLAGGVAMMVRRVADGAIAFGVLGGVLVTAALPSMEQGAFFHLSHGATMACAFFIATDPVSAPADGVARMVYGALVGALVVAIREAGGYPDGVAFAVLLGNAAAPLLDRLAASARR